MNSVHENDGEREARLNQALLQCLEAVQADQATDRRALAARYPEFAAELREFFALREQIDRLAAPLRDVASSAAPSEPRSISEAGQSSSHAAGGLGAIGEFRLLREIGHGGMGVVYEAHQSSLNRRVALKVLPFAAALDPKQLQRFQNEAQAAAQLHHTNIVPVFAVGAERGVHYYAMQLIEGQSLAALVEELRQQERLPAAEPPITSPSAGAVHPRAVADEATGPYPPLTPAEARAVETAGPHAAAISTDRSTRRSIFFRRVAQLGLRAAEALEHAHQAGVVHRDIKPANLLVDVRGNLWITDFGLALFQTGAGLTMTGELLGTLRYMSPEQAWARRGEVDHRTDIYSLGVTLYELLTLRPVFEGQDRQELLYQIAHVEPREPRRVDRTIPVELETIVLKAIAKAPAERYGTAQEMADDLQRFLEDKPILAKRPSLRDRAVKWTRRHRPVVFSAVALMAVVTVGCIVSTILVAREHAEAKAAYESERQRALEAGRQRARAEASFLQARRAVDFFVEVSSKDLAERPEWQPVRLKLLEAALDYYQQFIDQHGDDPALQAELAKSFNEVAAILSELDGRPRAVAYFENACAKQEQIARAHPDDHRFRHGLASAQDNLFFLKGGGQIMLLTQEAVADDLKLSEEQRVELAPLLHRVGQQHHHVFKDMQRIDLEQQRESIERTVQVNQRDLAEVLRPDQLRRLKQIDWQLLGPQAFGNPEVVAAIRLAGPQAEQIRRIQGECFPPPGGPPSHGTPEDGRKKMEEARRDAVNKVVAILTDEQKRQWQELIGQPFRGEMRFGPPRPPPPGFHPR